MLDSEGFVSWVSAQFKIALLSDRFSEEILSWSQGNFRIISYHFITGQSFSKDKCYTHYGGS